MTEQIKLGHIITGEANRDAIHIAIAPVVADEKLAPGQDIGFVDSANPEKVGQSDKPVGIVDPFLKQMVFPGQKIFMFLYPNTVTSLRHHWTHPAFEDTPTTRTGRTKDESESWLREFCSTHDCPSYETILSAVRGEPTPDDECYGYRLDHDYFFFRGTDAHSEIPPEFWDHIENVTGEKCRYRPSYFSCSC